MHNDFIKKFQNLECSVIDTNGSTVEVSYDMHCTMIDGSVANVLSDTNSASRCFLCNASPTDMNNINIIKDPCINNYKYGLSTLHCWIRFFECILHIAYRLPLKVWRANKENTSVFSQNKKRIQNEFKTRTGLIIDQVKTGFGTTNDGNTTRRFFENSEISAEITGIDGSLIDNFGIILRVLSCGIPVNVTTFKELLNITRNSYLIQYGWYYMPSTVHKVLVHGCDVLEYFNLPIGCLSEEALEASHKSIRNVRLSHTRKTKRENTNRDLMAHLLLMSDPELSSLRSTKHIKKMMNSKKLKNRF